MEQTVIDNPQATDDLVDTGTDAQDSLESALSEFDEATQPKKEATQSNDVQQLVEIMKNERQERIARETNEAIANAVVNVKGDLDIDNDIVEGFILKMSQRDPRIVKAFDSRNQSPDMWDRVQKQLSKDLQKRIGQRVDAQITTDREAVAAAVKGASKTKQSTEDYDFKKMSDADFNNALQEMGL